SDRRRGTPLAQSRAPALDPRPSVLARRARQRVGAAAVRGVYVYIYRDIYNARKGVIVQMYSFGALRLICEPNVVARRARHRVGAAFAFTNPRSRWRPRPKAKSASEEDGARGAPWLPRLARRVVGARPSRLRSESKADEFDQRDCHGAIQPVSVRECR